MTENIIYTIGTVVVAVITVYGTIKVKRSPERGTTENALIDQLQELIAEQRQINKEQRDALLASQVRERQLLDYVAILRAHIEGRLDPPAPRWPEGLL